DAQQHPQRLRQLLPDGGAALRGGQEIHRAFEELLAGVRRRVAERRVEDLLLEKPVEVRLQRGQRPLAGDAGLEPGEHVDPAAAPVVHVVPVRRHLRFHRDRDAQVGDVADVHAVEPGLRDANDRELVIVGDDRLAQHVRIGGEARAPVVGAEGGHPSPTAAPGVMTGPSAAPTPSTWKYVPETISAGTRSLWPSMPTTMASERRANAPEKIFGVGAGLGSVALTRGMAGALPRSTKLSRKSSYIGNESI